jgi:hypothetical protein
MRVSVTQVLVEGVTRAAWEILVQFRAEDVSVVHSPAITIVKRPVGIYEIYRYWRKTYHCKEQCS